MPQVRPNDGRAHRTIRKIHGVPRFPRMPQHFAYGQTRLQMPVVYSGRNLQTQKQKRAILLRLQLLPKLRFRRMGRTHRRDL